MRRDEGLHTLINQAISGNRDSFSQIYDLTIEEVTRAVYFLLADRADLEDVIQETYIQAYNSLSKFDSSRSFKPWLVGIAINQVKKQRRKNFKLFMLSEKKKQFSTPSFYEDASQLVLSTLENEELLTCIEKLPVKLKQVIILRYLNEYSQEEIASILDIPVGTVKSRIHSALSKLRGLNQLSTIFQISEGKQ